MLFLQTSGVEYIYADREGAKQVGLVQPGEVCAKRTSKKNYEYDSGSHWHRPLAKRILKALHALYFRCYAFAPLTRPTIVMNLPSKYKHKLSVEEENCPSVSILTLFLETITRRLLFEITEIASNQFYLLWLLYFASLVATVASGSFL